MIMSILSRKTFATNSLKLNFLQSVPPSKVHLTIQIVIQIQIDTIKMFQGSHLRPLLVCDVLAYQTGFISSIYGIPTCQCLVISEAS